MNQNQKIKNIKRLNSKIIKITKINDSLQSDICNLKNQLTKQDKEFVKLKEELKTETLIKWDKIEQNDALSKFRWLIFTVFNKKL